MKVNNCTNCRIFRCTARYQAVFVHYKVTVGTCTKLDGTAKGGIVVAVADALQIPVKFVGVGEQADDLMPFVADDFVKALIGDE